MSSIDEIIIMILTMMYSFDNKAHDRVLEFKYLVIELIKNKWEINVRSEYGLDLFLINRFKINRLEFVQQPNKWHVSHDRNTIIKPLIGTYDYISFFYFLIYITVYWQIRYSASFS